MNIVARTERTVMVPLQDVLEYISYIDDLKTKTVLTIPDPIINSGYRNWFHDPDVTRHNAHGLFPYGKRAMEEYKASLESNDIICWAVLIEMKKKDIIPKTDGFTQNDIVLEHDIYTHIGNITLQRVNWVYRSAEMAIVMGEKDYWGKGYATEALTALFDHGFNRLNLHRIWSGTANTNTGMQKVFEKLHMFHEGTFIDAMFLNGRWVDIIEYAVLRDIWHTYHKNPYLEEEK